MRAITLWQPWASFMALGVKTIETRGWRFDHAGTLAIHAAKRWTEAQYHITQALCAKHRDLLPAEFWRGNRPAVLGCVVAIVEMQQCVRIYRESATPWHGPLVADIRGDRELVAYLATLEQAQREIDLGDFGNGRFAWICPRVVNRFAEPVPAAGKQGVWDWRPSARSKS